MLRWQKLATYTKRRLPLRGQANMQKTSNLKATQRMVHDPIILIKQRYKSFLKHQGKDPRDHIM